MAPSSVTTPPIPVPTKPLVKAANAPAESVIQLASLICGGVLLTSLILLFVIKSKHGVLDSGIHPYLLKWAGDAGNYNGQRSAHRFALIAAACLLLSGPSILRFARPFLSKINWLAPRLIVPALLCYSGSAVVYYATDSAAIAFAIGTLCLAVNSVRLSQVCRLRAADYATITIFLVAMAALPALFTPLDLTRMPVNQIVDVQNHYSTVAMTGDRLAAGQHLFSEVRQHYGVLFQTLSGVLQKSFGSFSFGTYALVIRCLTTVLLAAMAWQYTRFAGRPSAASLAPLLLILPWLHTNQLSEYYPNLSSWRLLGIPLCFGALIYLHRAHGTKRTAALGVLAGILIALNLESGISLTLGILAFIAVNEKLLSLKSLKAATQHAGWFGLGLAIAAISLYLVASAALGYLPDVSQHLQNYKQALSVLKTGYSSLPLVYEPAALLIFCHCMYALIKMNLRRDQQWASKDGVRVAAIVTMLVWFSYYANRPSAWTLYSQFIIYGFLLCDMVRTIAIQTRRHTAKLEPALPLILALSFIVVPQIVTASNMAYPAYRDTWERLTHKRPKLEAFKVNGVMIAPPVAGELIRKAEFIKKQSQRGPVTYLTSNTVLIPKLSGVYSTVHLEDPYQELILDHQTVSFIKDLIKQKPEKIYFDAPGSLTAGDDLRRQCYAGMKARISPVYENVATVSGWEVWRLKAKSTP